MSKSEILFAPKCDNIKDEDDGYCSEQTADLTSDDSDLEERTRKSSDVLKGRGKIVFAV